MSETIKILVQRTPNPNALKFVTNRTLKAEGKISFNSLEECIHVPLVREIMSLPNVAQIHLFDNVMTVTQNGLSEWDSLSALVQRAMQEHLPDHNPDIMSTEEIRKSQLTPEMKMIEDILDEEIRPALQADGGDLQVLEYDQHVLTIKYEGACGSCPSSSMGTLEAIEGVLRDRFDPQIEVCAI
jgi:Fe-S cluster biogenesis protein NfuA